jgi:hypothetical protein
MEMFMHRILKSLTTARMVVLLSLAPLYSQSITPQHTDKEAIYQRVESNGLLFEGVVISQDGRSPQVEDAYWNKSSHKRNNQLPFKYVFNIRAQVDDNNKVVSHINLSHLAQLGAVPGVDGSFGPLWFAGYSASSNRVCFWHWEGEGTNTFDLYGLYFWDLVEQRFVATTTSLVTAWDQGSSTFHKYQHPNSLISMSGKYLAVIGWDSFSDGVNGQRNHIEIFDMKGHRRSLKESQEHNAIAQFGDSNVEVASMKWNEGDQLIVEFKRSSPSSPPNSRIKPKDNARYLDSVYPDNLFGRP